MSSPPGSAASLVGGSSFVPDQPGAYSLVAVATDSRGAVARTQPLVLLVSTCGTLAPSALALSTSNSSPNIGEVVALSASGLGYPEASYGQTCVGTAVSYHWSLLSAPAGSRAQLSSATLSAPSLQADASSGTGCASPYVVQARVTDAAGKSITRAINICAKSCGLNAPAAQAGLALPFAAAPATALAANVPAGLPVQLTAQAQDADNTPACGNLGQAIGFRWAFTGVPAGSRAALNNAAVQAPTFTPDVPGEYALTLTATDSTGLSGTATVKLTAPVAPSTLQSAGETAHGPYSAIAADGSVAQLDLAQNGNVRLARRSGASWSFTSVEGNAQAFTQTAQLEARPVDVAFDPGSGRLWVAWYNNKFCTLGLASFAPNGGGQLSSSAVEVPDGNCNRQGQSFVDYGRWLSLAITPTGAPALAYTQLQFDAGGNTTAANVRYAVCNGGCASVYSFSRRDVFPLAAGVRQGLWPSLRISSSGIAKLAYYDLGNGQLLYAESDAAQTSFTTGLIDDGGNTDTGRYASLDLTPAGAPRVAYRDLTTGALRYAICDASCAAGLAAWSAQTVAAGDNRFISLALDRNGAPHIAFRDQSRLALRYAVWGPQGFTVATLADGDAGEYASLAVEKQTDLGAPRISFFDRAMNAVRLLSFGP
jgi:hypothetical protein